MTTAEVHSLTDDQALLLQWVNITLGHGLYRDRPQLAELVAFTLHQLADALEPGPLRAELDRVLVDVSGTIRAMNEVLERRTH